MSYFLGTEDDYLAIFNTEEVEHRVLPFFSVLIRTKEELQRLETVMNDPEIDLGDYLEREFDLGQTYFICDSGGRDDVDFETYVSYIKEGIVYLLNERRFATLEDLNSLYAFWAIFNGYDASATFTGPFQALEEVQPNLFKSSDERYFTWDPYPVTTHGAIELELTDEEAIELALMPFNNALASIEECYPVTLKSGMYQNWGSQLYFETGDGLKIWTVEEFMSYNFWDLRLKTRDLQAILEDVRDFCE